ncbi:transposase [Rhodococcus sp. 27YEA15]
MIIKNYTEEFRRDAVELYRDTDGATVAGIAADLGISHGPLSTWLKNAGIPIRRHTPAAHRGPTSAKRLSKKLPGSAPRSHTYARRKPSSKPSETSCGRRPHISPETNW